MSGRAWATIENIVTICAIAAIILGIWAVGGGGWCFWALLLLSNLNTVYPKS